MKKKYMFDFEGGPVSQFDCDKGSPNFHLQVSKNPVLGWTMKDVNRIEVCPQLKCSHLHLLISTSTDET